VTSLFFRLFHGCFAAMFDAFFVPFGGFPPPLLRFVVLLLSLFALPALRLGL
jgi:hypothetical protein